MQTLAKIHYAGTNLSQAKAVMIMVHGRGADAEGILSLQPYLDAPQTAFVAPEAKARTWYPHSFLSPIQQNEPYLSQSLAVLAQLQQDLVQEQGFSPQKIFWLGFSQGACLSIEFLLRTPQKYAGAFILSGGMIKTQPNYEGNFEQTPIFLGCSDQDPHIPAKRVQETADVLQKLGAEVNMQLYPKAPHSITPTQITQINQILKQQLH